MLIASASGILFLYIFSQDWAHRELRDGFRLGFTAMAASFAMLLCGLGLVLDGRRHGVEEGMDTLRGIDWTRAIGVLLLCGAFFLGAIFTEFTVAAPVFVFVLTYLFGVRPWWACVVASIVMTTILFALFGLIGAELPGSG